MVATSQKHVRGDPDDGEWGTIQIAAPAIVGGVLLLLFAAYLIWQRRPRNRRSDYQQVRAVRSEWVTKIERIFVPRRKQHRVVRSSAAITLDDSMSTSGLTLDFSRRSRQCRSNSFDSQTPLTSTSYAPDLPPNQLPDYPPNRFSDSPLQIPRRPTVRWWWLFGSRPQQIKSQEPGQRWRVDDPDGSTEHGHSSHGHRFAGALEPLREAPYLEDDVIRIGPEENFPCVASTPMTKHAPEQSHLTHEMQTVPEQPSGSGTPIPAAIAQSYPGTSVLSANRDLPPSYDVSKSNTGYTPMEDQSHFGPYKALPPPVRAAGYPSPHTFHGRELSSDSFLAAQPPMVASSVY